MLFQSNELVKSSDTTAYIIRAMYILFFNRIILV